MAMILQVIFAVCCFVEMISAGPIPANTTIELLRLNRTLFAACGKIMASSKDCNIARITFFNSKNNATEMCSNSKNVFGDIHCALKNISDNDCINNATMTKLQNDTYVLSEGRNVTCSKRVDSSMKRFCTDFQAYVSRILAKCQNKETKKMGN